MKNSKVVLLTKFYKGELNPFDASALEIALSAGFKDITVVTMAPPSALSAFADLTRLGVKGVFITDTAYAGSDTIATSFILANALKRLNPSLIFCGRQSVDGDTAQVPPMLATRLGFNIKTQIVDINDGFVIDREGKRFTLENNIVISFERTKSLRFPSIFSKKGEVEIWDNSLLNLDVNYCGQLGSPTKVVNSYKSEVGRRFCNFYSIDCLDKLIKEGLSKYRKEESLSVSEKLDKVCYVGNIENIAKQIAKKVIKLSIDGQNEEQFIKKLQEINPQAVLWEDDKDIKLYGSKIATLMGVGLCADCISFSVKQGKLIMTRPALGGDVTADIICNGKMSFATVRTVRQDCKDVVFTIGNGGVDYIDKITALAKKYDAELCSSRIVTDSGKMPYSSQVGLTGKRVSPKVYVAFGVSGAVQHTSAISGAGTIIAINKDKNARIFDYADYGMVDDIKNFFE